MTLWTLRAISELLTFCAIPLLASPIKTHVKTWFFALYSASFVMLRTRSIVDAFEARERRNEHKREPNCTLPSLSLSLSLCLSTRQLQLIASQILPLTLYPRVYELINSRAETEWGVGHRIARRAEQSNCEWPNIASNNRPVCPTCESSRSLRPPSAAGAAGNAPTWLRSAAFSAACTPTVCSLFELLVDHISPTASSSHARKPTHLTVDASPSLVDTRAGTEVPGRRKRRNTVEYGSCVRHAMNSGNARTEPWTSSDVYHVSSMS